MKAFPIQLSSKISNPHPMLIPWDIAELAYSVYVSQYGRRQSLERLAERGGFSSREMDEFLPDWRERCDRVRQLTQALLDIKGTAQSRMDQKHGAGNPVDLELWEAVFNCANAVLEN